MVQYWLNRPISRTCGAFPGITHDSADLVHGTWSRSAICQVCLKKSFCLRYLCCQGLACACAYDVWYCVIASEKQCNSDQQQEKLTCGQHRQSVFVIYSYCALSCCERPQKQLKLTIVFSTWKTVHVLSSHLCHPTVCCRLYSMYMKWHLLASIHKCTVRTKRKRLRLTFGNHNGSLCV